MADDDAANLFGFEDSSLAFIDEGSPSGSGDVKSDPSDDAQFDSSGWEFPDNIPFTFDASSSAPAIANSYPTSVWDSPPFDFEQSPMLGFDDISTSSNNDTSFLFGDSVAQQLQVQAQTQLPPQTQPQPQPHLQLPSQAHAQPRQQQPSLGVLRQPITTLTPDAQEKLRNIAMPPHLLYHSPKSASSPESSNGDGKNGSSSRGRAKAASKTNSKKRKVSEDHGDDDDDDDDDEDRPVKKTSHNMIEKRYRNNLNDKIAALRDAVPSLRIMSKSAKGEDTTEDRQELHGLTPAHKLNKATVLSKATEYIRHLEKRYGKLQEENQGMRERIAAFEKLFLAGAMNGSIPQPVQQQQQQPQTPMQFAAPDSQQASSQQQQNFLGSPTNSQENSVSPSGMIPVPDDMKRILAAQMASGQTYAVPQQTYQTSPQTMMQQQLMQQPQGQQTRWGNAAPYFGKLMVGSLAGLMIMEAVRQEEVNNESPEGRGLFALPLHLLGQLSHGLDFHLMGYHVHTSLKVLLLLGTVLWVFIPSLFSHDEDKSEKPRLSTLQPAPSLASSIHVRRQAWLTAVQSVWIPRNTLLLEASALVLKAAKLSAVRVLGAHGYKVLSRATEDQETARAKAWSIALDSQLVGGDVEINTSRLLITLLASGALPDTPARLMLKALHIRVLLWNLSHHKWNSGLTNAVAASLARSRWNEARQLNHTLAGLRRKSGTQHDDELPDHLAYLVDQSCDDVLNADLIQRAHNLAFNRDTKHGVENPIDGMDSVVEDTSIGSPMDAVAAWWSTQLLHEALMITLARGEEGPHARDTKMDLALHAAPVGSAAQARAIVARAALSDQHRGSNIALALQTVGTEKTTNESPSSSDETTTTTTVTAIVGSQATPVTSPDVRLALRCATAIAHLRRFEKRGTGLQDLRIIDSISIPRDPSAMSLLGFAAIMELVDQVFGHKAASETYSPSIERLAGGLRLWMGGSAGDGCGVPPSVRHKVVDRCLDITKSIVGMEVDTGYGSLSEGEL